MPTTRKRKYPSTASSPSETTKPSDSTIHDHDSKDTTHSVLGGLRGGYRLDPDTSSTSNNTIGLTVPFEGKSAVCQLYQPPSIRSSSTTKEDELPQPKLIFTHGAGGGLSNPATAEFCAGYAEREAVLAMQGTMNLQHRVRTFGAVVSDLRGRGVVGKTVALGGRSMGARAACLASKELKGVSTLVLVSYPLLAEKGGGLEERARPLWELDEGVDVLFIVGDGDAMCPRRELDEVRRSMKARSWVCGVQGADHTMSLKGAKGKGMVSAMRRKTGAVAAEWVESKTEERGVGWVDVGDGKFKFDGWIEDEDSKVVEEDENEAKDSKRKRRRK